MKRAFAFVFAVCLLPLRTSAGDFSPKEIYLQALATMHALPEKPFLQFSYDWQVTQNDVRADGNWSMTLQSSTGIAHMVQRSDGKVIDEPFLMRPDLLIAHPAPAATPPASAFVLGTDVDPAEKLPTIAVVVARAIRYDVTLIGRGTAPGCAGAYHLGLVPITDPERNNLRELWVDTSTFRVCRAIAIWKAGVADGHIFPVTFTLFFDRNGFISTWSAEGAVGQARAQTRYVASGAYEDVKQLDASPISGWPRQ